MTRLAQIFRGGSLRARESREADFEPLAGRPFRDQVVTTRPEELTTLGD